MLTPLATTVFARTSRSTWGTVGVIVLLMWVSQDVLSPLNLINLMIPKIVSIAWKADAGGWNLGWVPRIRKPVVRSGLNEAWVLRSQEIIYPRSFVRLFRCCPLRVTWTGVAWGHGVLLTQQHAFLSPPQWNVWKRRRILSLKAVGLMAPQHFPLPLSFRLHPL